MIYDAIYYDKSRSTLARVIDRNNFNFLQQTAASSPNQSLLFGLDCEPAELETLAIGPGRGNTKALMHKNNGRGYSA